MLQDCESSLKQKTELVSKLEFKTHGINDSLDTLEDKLRSSEQNRAIAESELKALTVSLAERAAAYSNLEGELKVERDWRSSLEETQIRDKEDVAKLNAEVTELRAAATHYLNLKEEYRLLQEDQNVLKEQCRLHELTLEELGSQLSVSKLKVVDMEEEAKAKFEGQWARDHDVSTCRSCNNPFNITRRKHHCRKCGEIFCHTCSDNTFLLPSSAKPVRVCDSCHVSLVARNSVL